MSWVPRPRPPPDPRAASFLHLPAGQQADQIGDHRMDAHPLPIGSDASPSREKWMAESQHAIAENLGHRADRRHVHIAGHRQHQQAGAAQASPAYRPAAANSPAAREHSVRLSTGSNFSSTFYDTPLIISSVASSRVHAALASNGITSSTAANAEAHPLRAPAAGELLHVPVNLWLRAAVTCRRPHLMKCIHRQSQHTLIQSAAPATGSLPIGQPYANAPASRSRLLIFQINRRPLIPDAAGVLQILPLEPNQDRSSSGLIPMRTKPLSHQTARSSSPEKPTHTPSSPP